MVSFEVQTLPFKYLSFFFLTALLTVQGCTTAAVAYGVSKLTTPKTEPLQQAPRSTELRTYPEYVTEMERINLEREKAGFQARPIMTKEEWTSAQTVGHPPMTPAPAAAPPAEPSEKASAPKE